MTDELHALKRISFGAQTSFTLNVLALPEDLQDLKLYLLCDSYLGMNQEIALIEPHKQPINVILFALL